ncbi:hypothetical protein OROMI_010155 [Orobanche minor]
MGDQNHTDLRIKCVVFLMSCASSTRYCLSSLSSGFFNKRRSAPPTRVDLHGVSPLPPTPTTY